MTAQIHLAHPALTAIGQVQCCAFVGTQGLPAFEHRRDAEGVIRQMNQTSGQRAFVEQPVEGGGIGEGRQFAAREPERSWRGGFCVMHNESLLAANEAASLTCQPPISIEMACRCAEQACIRWLRSVQNALSWTAVLQPSTVRPAKRLNPEEVPDEKVAMYRLRPDLQRSRRLAG
ncbi:hypothetical protein D3C79_857840 [compost metagenome]